MELTVNHQPSCCAVNINFNQVFLHSLYFYNLIVQRISTTLSFQITSLVADYRIHLLVTYNSQLLKVLDNLYAFDVITITTVLSLDCLLSSAINEKLTLYKLFRLQYKVICIFDTRVTPQFTNPITLEQPMIFAYNKCNRWSFGYTQF